MDLLFFLKVLYRKKWVLIGLSLFAVIVAFLLVVNKKPEFSSVAQFSTGFTTERVKLVDGSSTIDLFAVDVKFDNVIETIKSPQVVSRISYSLLLHDLADPAKAYTKLNEKELQDPILKEISADTVKTILAEKISRNEMLQPDILRDYRILEYLKLYKYDYLNVITKLDVSRVARTDYLNITYTSPNPLLSAYVVNSIGTEFLNYYKNLNLSRTSETAVSIKGLVESQQRKVDSLSRILLNEKISEGTIDPVSRTTSAMETVTDLESKLADERGKYNLHVNRLSFLNAQLSGLQGGGSSGNDDVVKLINRKNDLVAELARKGGSDAALEKQISDLRNEIASKSSAGVSKTKQKELADDLRRQISEENALVQASESTISDYEGRIKRYMGLTNLNPGSSVKMDVIRTQLDMENKQLSSIKQKYSQVEGLAKDDPTSNFIQTRVGQPAAEPNSKQTMLKMALAGVSMFFLASVIFIFLEVFDTSVKTPGIFSRQVKTKVNTVINKVNLKKISAAEVVQLEKDGRKYLNYNIFKNNIRKLRYELLKSGKQIFLFTSTQKKSGKSTLIQALASSLLLSHKRVLILDLNFSNNSLTRFFETTVFIQDVVQNTDKAKLLNHKIIGAPTKYKGLDIIGCQEGNITPAEVLYNIEIEGLFNNLKETYDIILIEGAALNSYADSKELAEYVDGIFTIYAADSSLLQLDNQSLKFINDQKEKNQGLILNKVLTENVNS